MKKFLMVVVTLTASTNAWGVLTEFELDNVTINTFSEGFDVGDATWASAAFGPLTYNSTGGNPGGYVSDIADADASTGTLFRGHDAFDSSGDAFVGDWIASGVDAISFDVRHDYPTPINFFARISTPSNFPAHIAIGVVPVLPNQWTTVSVPVDPSSPFLINEGESAGFNYADTFSNVGNIQIGVDIVPEPNAAFLTAFALACLAVVRRKFAF